MALFGSGKNPRQGAQYEQRRSNSRQQQRYQNERELREQRVKSRNRLIGSVILVLAAIIILPMILKTGDDSTPTETSAPLIAPGSGIGQSGLVVESSPGVQTPTDPELGTESIVADQEDPAIAEGTSQQGDDDMPLAVAEGMPEGEDDVSASETSDVSVAESTASESAEAEAAARERAEQEAAARERARQQQAQAQQQKQQEQAKPAAPKANNRIADNKRTDDGSQALAILEGRTPPATNRAQAPASSSTTGEYSLQVASYSSANDARAQRERLRSSGVSNAYVQSATVNGKQVFRLRVGPFSTKEAAQAAQTRLRALNFSDSFVTGR